MKKIYPILPEYSKEVFLSEKTVKSKAIYVVVVLIVFLVLALLPVVKVSLSVQGRGIIRPLTGKTDVKTLKSEVVVKICKNEGQYVHKGDTILELRRDLLQTKANYLFKEHDKYTNYLSDLNMLVNNKPGNPQTSMYTKQLAAYNNRMAEATSILKKATKELERNKELFQKNYISEKEYDDLKYEVQQLRKKRDILKSTQIANWQSDAVQHKSKVEELQKEIRQYEREKSFYYITSPVSGTIEEFMGIYTGSIVQAGQTVAVVSPDSEKVAEVYLPVNNIAYISKGQKSKIQVDAFNYNQWGTITGEVQRISEDFILVNDVPVFKVICRLENEYLELAGGTAGILKKGMTVNVRFMTGKRSLFELLYEKSDNWINPSRNIPGES